MEIRVCVGNYGYYNEGELRDRWVSLPMRDDDLEAWLVGSGLKDSRHEEVYVSDYEGFSFGEFADVCEINALAKVIDDAAQSDLDAVRGALECGVDEPRTPLEFASLVLQANEIPYVELPEYGLFSTPEERLGYLHAEETGLFAKLDECGMADYFDYERYGRDLALDFYLGEDGYVYDDMPDYGYCTEEDLREISREWDERHAAKAA